MTNGTAWKTQAMLHLPGNENRGVGFIRAGVVNRGGVEGREGFLAYFTIFIA